MPKGQAIKYTPEQLDYIKSNCNLGRKELTLKVNIKFNTNFSVDSIKSLCTRNKWNTGRMNKPMKQRYEILLKQYLNNGKEFLESLKVA